MEAAGGVETAELGAVEEAAVPGQELAKLLLGLVDGDEAFDGDVRVADLVVLDDDFKGSQGSQGAAQGGLRPPGPPPAAAAAPQVGGIVQDEGSVGRDAGGVKGGQGFEEGAGAGQAALEVVAGRGPQVGDALAHVAAGGLSVHLGDVVLAQQAQAGQDALGGAVAVPDKDLAGGVVHLQAVDAAGHVDQPAGLAGAEVGEVHPVKAVAVQPGLMLGLQVLGAGGGDDVGGLAPVQDGQGGGQAVQAGAREVSGQVVEEQEQRRLGGQLGAQRGRQAVLGQELKGGPRLKDAIGGDVVGGGPGDELDGLAGLAQLRAAGDDQAGVGVQVGGPGGKPVDPGDGAAPAQAGAELAGGDGCERLGARGGGRLLAEEPAPDGTEGGIQDGGDAEQGGDALDKDGAILVEGAQGGAQGVGQPPGERDEQAGQHDQEQDALCALHGRVPLDRRAIGAG